MNTASLFSKYTKLLSIKKIFIHVGYTVLMKSKLNIREGLIVSDITS